MKNLCVIYGPPRSDTTFMLGALVQHPLCFGTDLLTKKAQIQEYTTNENPFLRVDQIANYTTLEKLFQYYNVPDDGYLVIKAPGYCFAWEYFNKSPYNCKYIFVNRDPFECVKSMMSIDTIRDISNLSIESTSCPKDRFEFYQDIWNQSTIEGKCLLRWHYHIDNIPKKMKKVSLNLSDYTSRKKANEVYLKIISYLQIPGNKSLETTLSLFRHKKMTKNETLAITLACQETTYWIHERNSNANLGL